MGRKSPVCVCVCVFVSGDGEGMGVIVASKSIGGGLVRPSDV